MPGDKSLTHRALILGALGDGPARVEGALVAEDTLATAACLRALGASIRRSGDTFSVEGGGFTRRRAALDAANSGTTARLLMGVLAGAGVEVTLGGDASLTARPMGRVVAPLRRAGARIAYRGTEGRLPVGISPAELRGTSHVLEVASAQVKSALLLAGLFAEGETLVRLPGQSRDHTERMLTALGAPIRPVDAGPGHEGWALRGPVRLPALGTVAVPGDPSSAAFLWAAAAVTDGTATTRGVGLNPRRIAFLDLLTSAGVEVRITARTEGAEPSGDVTVSGRPLRPMRVDGSQVAEMIDELPAAAAVMAVAPGTSRVSGAAELRVKESDRIAAMAEGIGALGGDIEEAPDGWTIRGGRTLTGARLLSRGDHRVAMALAVLALQAEGPSVVAGAECVGISYPGFFEALNGASPSEGEA